MSGKFPEVIIYQDQEGFFQYIEMEAHHWDFPPMLKRIVHLAVVFQSQFIIRLTTEFRYSPIGFQRNFNQRFIIHKGDACLWSNISSGRNNVLYTWNWIVLYFVLVKNKLILITNEKLKAYTNINPFGVFWKRKTLYWLF